ncbi:MAG: zinc ABC transporter substrate-binding protein [Actinobacteria bacterium]|nr:zinc ABC transporter substrate-binding protein [Actinomycetota bacterium]
MRTRIILTVLVALLPACGGSSDDEQLEIVAAFYPLAYAAERVAPTAEVENLTPAGAEPHDLELSARDVQRVQEADTVLYLGAGFMPALEQAVEGRANAVDLLAGRGAAQDPHVWLDPLRYAAIVRTIATVLGDRAAADELVARLQRLDGEFRAGLADCERRELVTSHAAFGHLAKRYRLEQTPLAGVSPEVEPSARAIHALVEQVEQRGATTVFFETLVSPKLAETVAREAGAHTAVLNPLEGLTEEELDAADDYFSVMRDNLAALREALACA